MLLSVCAVTDSMNGRSTNSECSPLGKSVLLPAYAVTDFVTGQPKNSECSSLGTFVSLSSNCSVVTVDTFITNICSVSAARAVTDSVTGRSKNSESSTIFVTFCLCRH